MGRPYADEIAALPDTYDFALSVELSALTRSIRSLRSRPIIIIGSGGSASAAQLSARLHEQHARLSARVMTPFEFLRYPVPQSAGVLLLSASGRNRDIIAAASHAIMSEYTPVVGLCTRNETPLRRALAFHRHCVVHEVVGPSRRDGFLATNSLLLTAIVLARAYGVPLPPSLPSLTNEGDQDSVLSSRLIREAGTRISIVALASDWAVPAAIDLESKWSEIGFGSVTVTDPRNFAHGRHHGLSRRFREALVLGMSAGEECDVLEQTLDVLPARAHKETLISPLREEAGALDLLIRVFLLAGAVGQRARIDIGQPRVPAFGRLLYHASPVPKRAARAPRAAPADAAHDLWIRRKVSHVVWESASEKTRELWRTECEKWIAAAEAEQIAGVVFDYDGTLCEEDERFGAPAAGIGSALTRLVQAGVSVGIATGRGDSVLTALRQVIAEQFWSAVIIGTYNGGCICRLSETPILEQTVRTEIQVARQAIKCSPQLAELVDIRERPTQLTIRCARPLPEGLLHRMVMEALRDNGSLGVQVMSSGHTVDLLASGVSKLRVVEAVRASCIATDGSLQLSGDGRRRIGRPPAIMTIGDQGQLGGNDATFLAHTLGLSVENVSSVFGECWNVAPAGLRRTAAVVNYLHALRVATPGSCRWSVAAASRRPPAVRASNRILSESKAV